MTKPFIILIFLLMQSCTTGGARLPDGCDSWYQASLPSVQESLTYKECCDEN